MTNQELNEIEARANSATEGPWHKNRAAIATNDSEIIFETPWAKDSNVQFAIHARQDVPALVAEVKRLRDGVIHGHVEWDGTCYPMTCGCCGGSAEETKDIVHNEDCPMHHA